MTDLEKALKWADGYTKAGCPGAVTLAAAYRAKCIEFKIVCAEHRAEKERADKAEEALKSLIKILDPEPLGTLSGMANMDNRLEWYEKMRPLREEARKIVTPSPRLEGEWPS